MRRSRILPGIIGLLTICLLASFGQSQEATPPPAGNGDGQNPIQVQPSGPIHEAFAQPFDVKPGPGPMVAKEPPPLLPEDPPSQKPDMDNVQWIPGYWAWDAQKQDYLWVSGTYRVPPQDRTYVPGYWQRADDGWRWVSGYWSGPKEGVPYTPEPPAALDAAGPSMQQPNDNSIYIPGAWVWRDDRFVWRPGYYAAAQLGRVWVPPHYVWTPSGYIFVDGYWDYPLEDRGLIFPPVYFAQPLWNDPNWRYQPNSVLDFGSFYDSAFVYGNGFVFGNYYGRPGYNPWYHGRGRYDPLFTYYGWRNHRNNPNWVAGVQQSFANRTAGRAVVPAAVTTPLARVNNVRLVQTTAVQQQAQRTFIQQTRQASVSRQQMDAAFRQTNTRSFTPNTGTTRSFSTPNTGTTRSFTPNTGTITRSVTTPHVTPSTTTPRVVAPTPAPRRSAAPTNTPNYVTHTQPLQRTVTTRTSAPVHVQSAPARVHTAAPARVHTSAPARSVSRSAPARHR
jgi:hypothetical protein